MQKDTFTHPITNPSKQKELNPNIHKDIDPQQAMGKDDKNYNDPKQNLPNQLGKKDVPFQKEAGQKGLPKVQ